jgi:hypothetical protein
MITLTLIEKLYQIEILENKTDINFITSDNPVKNLLTTSDKHVELYWPISPRKAVLIKSTHFSPAEAASIKKNILNHGKNADYILRTKSVNDENKINELNKATWENKHRHAFYLADKDIVPLELRTP